MPKPTPKPSPSTYEQMLSRMEYLFDTAETPKDKAEAIAYRKALEKKFPTGAPKLVRRERVPAKNSKTIWKFQRSSLVSLRLVLRLSVVL